MMEHTVEVPKVMAMVEELPMLVTLMHAWRSMEVKRVMMRIGGSFMLF